MLLCSSLLQAIKTKVKIETRIKPGKIKNYVSYCIIFKVMIQSYKNILKSAIHFKILLLIGTKFTCCYYLHNLYFIDLQYINTYIFNISIFCVHAHKKTSRSTVLRLVTFPQSQSSPLFSLLFFS